MSRPGRKYTQAAAEEASAPEGDRDRDEPVTTQESQSQMDASLERVDVNDNNEDGDRDTESLDMSLLSAPPLSVSHGTLLIAEKTKERNRSKDVDREMDQNFFKTLDINKSKELLKNPLDKNALLLTAAASSNSSSIDLQMIMEEYGPSNSVKQVMNRDSYGRTALHVAAMSGCADTVTQLLETYRTNLYEKSVVVNIRKLEKERKISEEEIKGAMIASGKYTAASWDMKASAKTNPQLISLQDWFENEVNRLHRAHEIRVEVYRTKCLVTKDRFGRTPLHYAVSAGCARAVMEALLTAGTASLNKAHRAPRSTAEHRHHSELHKARRTFFPDAIYESATGLQMVSVSSGSKKGHSSSAFVPNNSSSSGGNTTKDTMREINLTLRNVAWELASQTGGGDGESGATVAELKKSMQIAESRGQEGMIRARPENNAPTSKPEDYTFEEEEENAYEVIIPWILRNLMRRAGEMCAVQSRTVTFAGDAKHDDTHSVENEKEKDESVPGSIMQQYNNSGALEQLETLAAQMSYVRGSNAVLLVPEVIRTLNAVGIQVTKKAVTELCRQYAADVGAVDSRWRDVMRLQREKKDQDAFASEAKGSSSSASGAKGDSSGGGGKATEDDDDHRNTSRSVSPRGHRDRGADSKSESQPKYEDNYDHGSSSGSSEKGEGKSGSGEDSADSEVKQETRARKRGEYLSLLSVNPQDYDTNVGLDLVFLITELTNGRALSAMTYKGPDPSTVDIRSSLDKGIATYCDGDEKKVKDLKELLKEPQGREGSASRGAFSSSKQLVDSLSPCVSIAIVQKTRRGVINVADSYGRTPLLIAAALGHKQLVEVLLAHGADTSIQSAAPGCYNAITLASSSTIKAMLEKALLKWLNGDGNGEANLKRFVEARKGVSSSTGGWSSSLGADVNEAMFRSQDGALGSSATSDFKGSTELSNKSNLIMGMTEHLGQLKAKNWAYSRSSLGWAVKNGIPEVVQQLLIEQSDPNETDTVGRTALHECASLIKDAEKEGGAGGVNVALLDSAVTIAEQLLHSGARVNAGSVGQKTPLHELFCKGQDEASSSFARLSSSSAGALKDHKNVHNYHVTRGTTPEQHAIIMKYKRSLLRILLQWGADVTLSDRAGMGAIHYCARENDVGCMLEMLRYADVDDPKKGVAYSTSSINQQIPLHVACKAGALDVIKLLCRWEADTGSDGSYMLELVDSQGKRSAQLLSSGSEPGCLDTLWSLSLQGNVSRLSAMLSAIRIRNDAGEGEGEEDDDCIDVNRDSSNPYVQDDNELADAAMASSVEGTGGGGEPQDHGREEEGKEESKGESKESDAGSTSNSTRGRKKTTPPQEPWLVDGVNSKSRRLRWTPLYAALVGWVRQQAGEGNKSAKRVWERGSGSKASSFSSFSGGRSPRGSGASSSPTRNNTRLGAGSTQYQQVVSQLLKCHSYVDCMDSNCRTPLMLAAASNIDSALRILLAAGADLHARDLDGNTALHIAYAHGSAAAMVTLEAKGADIDARNYHNKTPLEIAGESNKVKSFVR